MTNSQRIILGSLAMDLKRVALGLHKHSLLTAATFQKEAMQRVHELESNDVDPYTKQLITQTKITLIKLEQDRAEDFLMYSTLFQNLTQKRT